jgi:hypothetical protein
LTSREKIHESDYRSRSEVRVPGWDVHSRPCHGSVRRRMDGWQRNGVEKRGAQLHSHPGGARVCNHSRHFHARHSPLLGIRTSSHTPCRSDRHVGLLGAVHGDTGSEAASHVAPTGVRYGTLTSASRFGGGSARTRLFLFTKIFISDILSRFIITTAYRIPSQSGKH